MDDDKITNQVPDEQESETEITGESRREFITKLVTAAGAVAVAGLAAGNAASAQEIKLNEFKEIKEVMSLKVGKVHSGFRLTLTGRQIGDALRQIGVLSESANLEKASVTIEFAA
jgi:hypothetical protein